MDLSILLVSYNTRALLEVALRSISQTVRGCTFEVIVVDNASSDGSVEMVAHQFPQARLIANDDNRGFAAANNQAMQVASGRYFLLLNSDAAVHPDAVEQMVQYLDNHPEVGVVGGQLRNLDGTFQSSYADFPTLPGELLLAAKLAGLFFWPGYPSYPEERSQSERYVDWVSGAFLMARRAAVRAVGPLDETYFMYTEETDWCFRMRKGGWLVAYLPSARAVHLGGQSARRVPALRRYQIYRSKWLFFSKHRSSLEAAVFRFAILAVSYLKLFAWLLRTLEPRPAIRAWARLQVRSYEVLLEGL